MRRTLPHRLTLLGLWTLFFWRFFTPNPADRLVFADGDFTQQFWVFRDLVYRQLAAGRLPLWTDCILSGYPLHADPQTSLFYLPSWITYGLLRLLGYGHYPLAALTAEVLAHYLFISFTLYFFLSHELSSSTKVRLSSPTFSALLGALVFTYSGYLTGTPPLQTATLQTLAWLPLTLLCLRRLTETRALRYIAFASFTLALAYFGGHPQTFVYVGGLSLAYLVYRARAEKRSWRTIGVWTLGWAALAAGLVAVQLLPSLQFIAGSTRASIPFDEAARGFPIQDIAQFFVTGLASYWQPLYLGLLPLGLAAFAGLFHSGSAPKFWAGLALGGLLLSFGTKAVVYDLAFWLVPLFKLFRGQEHFSLVVVFSLSVLAAYGANLSLGPLPRRLRRALAAFRNYHFALFTFFLLCLLLIFLFNKGDHFAARFGSATLFSMLAAFALHIRLRWPAARRWWPVIFLLVAALDLFTANRGLNTTRPFETYAYDPLLDSVLADTGFFRVQDDVQLKGQAACGYGVREIGSITPYQPAAYAEFLARAPERARWQLLGVKYVTTWRQDLYTWEGEQAGAEPVAERPSSPGVQNTAGITKLFRLNIEPRRAFVAYDVRVAQTSDDVYAGLAAPGFDPLQIVYIPSELRDLPSPSPAPALIEVIGDQPGEVEIEIQSESPGVLILSEVYAPGWRATVNGQRAPVLVADGALIGVPIPAGDSAIQLTYRPSTLLLGALISIISLVLCLALLNLSRRRSPP